MCVRRVSVRVGAAAQVDADLHSPPDAPRGRQHHFFPSFFIFSCVNRFIHTNTDRINSTFSVKIRASV